MQTTATRERPILFSGEMVRALLDGRKTQTRRVVKPQPPDGYECDTGCPGYGYNPFVLIHRELTCAVDGLLFKCPYGDPGDRLWVRETWGYFGGDEYLYQRCPEAVGYRATHMPLSPIPGGRWRPSIHMPHWASRLTLEVTDVRVQRLQEITEEDACAEGANGLPNPCGFPTGRQFVCCKDGDEFGHTATDKFRHLWNKLNAPRGFGWDVNPWVWVITFRKVTDA